jgi:chromosome segregation ATPase
MPSTEIVVLASVLAALASFFAIIAFWTRLSDRITKADTKADNAQQEAAEAKNENDNLRETIAAMSREIDELLERRGREHGEGLSAIRQHVTDLAFFVRDNFVKQSDFASAMKEIKDSQSEIVKMLNEMRERLPRGRAAASGLD